MKAGIYQKILNNVSSDLINTLLNTSYALNSSLNLGEILQAVVENAVSIFELETGSVYTLDEQELRLGAACPHLPDNFPEELRLAALADHPHIRKAVDRKAPVVVANVEDEIFSEAEQQAIELRNLVSLIYVPLIVRDEVLGVFIVGSSGYQRHFFPDEITLCNAFAAQAATAVNNAQMYQQTQRAVIDLTLAYDSTIEGWSRILELRDHDTDQHTSRVAGLTLKLAQSLKVPDDQLPDIRRGALLHDIGKMGIPDSILLKPGKLNEEEWEIMKTHCELAREYLSSIEFLKPALDIPYCHHEKWDGTGYPRGLKGREIPFAARLFSIVDVYDALTSDRVYRPAWSQAEVVEYFQKESGKHFDPAVVKAFIILIQKS